MLLFVEFNDGDDMRVKMCGEDDERSEVLNGYHKSCSAGEGI